MTLDEAPLSLPRAALDAARLPATRVLFEDPELLVLDKPAGVSTDSGAADDMLHRARAFLVARDGAAPPLSAPWPLPRDASGVLVLARRKGAHAALAAQFAEGPPRGRWVVRAQHGQGAAAPSGARARRAQQPGKLAAEGALRTVAHRPGLLEALRPTLRAPAHLAALSLVRGDGARLELAAPTPAALAEGPLDERLEALLHDGLQRRLALLERDDLGALRALHERSDGAPGLTVDLYGPFALLQTYVALDEPQRARLAERVGRALGVAGVYAKHRPPHASRVADAGALAPPRAVWGDDAPDELSVREGACVFRVRLGEGLSTGVFLDQRGNRARLAKLARDRTVLNLFAYAGAFTVAALRGGARATTSVDVAAPALAWAARNLAANGAAEDERHRLVRADVFGWLDGAVARRERYDVVVLDPPGFATTRDGGRFSADSDYRSLAARALRVTAPRGALLACCNVRAMPEARFRRYLYEAARDAGHTVQRLRTVPPDEDFAPPLGEEPYLKSAWLELR